MKIECDKCHKVMYVPLKEAIRLYWYKLKKELVVCPACGDVFEEEFKIAGDMIVERCKNLIKKLDEDE